MSITIPGSKGIGGGTHPSVPLAGVDLSYAKTLLSQGKITTAQYTALSVGGSPAVLQPLLNAQDYALLTGTQLPPVAPAILPVLPWTPTVTAADGQSVTLNGCHYRAIGPVPAGVVPPMEVASPATPGSPRYILLASGHTPVAVPYDATIQYYQGAYMSFLGAKYVLDAPNVPVATAPTDSRWTAISGTPMTNAESQLLTAACLVNVANATLALRTPSAGDSNRVKQHFLSVTATGAAGPGLLGTVNFPVPIPGTRTPRLGLCYEGSVLAAAFKPLGILPNFNSAGNCTGYTLQGAVALATTDVINFEVTVDEVNS